ncbi:hypothetical protein GQ53DRAFT_784347 [Thozetella sp. PMI_491]|nr:hypothetical protein GQ53DRAFT_784347 [Thozetella sp. PMI_491]
MSTIMDPPSLQPTKHLAPRGRQLRSTSASPTRQRTTDDLLARLSPSTAVAVFQNPSGALKECMDATTPAEQSFALRTALASQKIHEWLEELSAWPWPAGGAPAAFELPGTRRRRLSRSEGSLPATADPSSTMQKKYMGSFLASDVTRYLERIDEISHEMEQLDLEEIKSHVLYNHIMPLSRPGTPMSDTARVVASSLSYNMMDDLTALITATILQALPNLSRLNRLMNAWGIRLTVLKRTTPFVSALEDAEISLRSAREALDPGQQDSAGSQSSNGVAPQVDLSTLSRQDFEVLKSILDVKVSRAGRHLDSMLDALEGAQDTLPEHWIDRMDSLEQQYGDWVALAERKAREAEWTAMGRAETECQDVATFDGPEDLDLPDHGTPERPRHRDTEREATPSEEMSPVSSPPTFRSSTRSVSVSFNDMPTVTELPDDESPPKTPIGSPDKISTSAADDQLQQQISQILESVPAKIRLTSGPPSINLNPPDFKMPTSTYTRSSTADRFPRSHSSLSTTSSRAGTPSFLLAPAFGRTSRQRNRGSHGEVKIYHLSRSNGEAPIKLLIRCVGENGERVMVRVGGGWADLGEYLKEYASHHGRRSGGEGKVEVTGLPRVSMRRGSSSPPSRPTSALESPVTPLQVRKTRRNTGEDLGAKLPKTPLTAVANNANETPSSGTSTRSRSSSRLSWTEDDSSLGMAGPRAKHIEMSDESKAWVESVKEKVRIASGERKPPEQPPGAGFGEIGKVGGTRRLFKKQT